MSIVVHNLRKSFTRGDTPAVDQVSFSAPSGAITCLLGPSGAGKSTVLRLIAGLERPDSGQIFVNGEDYGRLPIQHRGVGFVFQNYALFEHMTVAENIGFALSIRKASKIQTRKRVDHLLELVQLQGLGARRPCQLSGGQRQRVGFARALAVEPRVLLLDEPFGALDAKVRGELRSWLAGLHREIPVTTLLITHDESEAFALAEHVVIMLNGRVAQADSPRRIHRSPAAAGFGALTG